MGSRKWTPEQVEYLQENWGKKSIPALAKSLERSEYAIKVKANRLHLGSLLDSGDYITFNQLYKAIYGRNPSAEERVRLARYDFPMHFHRVQNNKFRIVFLDEFWNWAEHNKTHIDFSRMEPYALGMEPDWLSRHRSAQYNQRMKLKSSMRWSAGADAQLQRMLAEGKSTIDDLCRALGRSAGSIYKRIQLKELPRPKPAEKRSSEWTAEEYAILEGLCLNAMNPSVMTDHLPRHSEKAIREKIYGAFGSEDVDAAAAEIRKGGHIQDQKHNAQYKREYYRLKKQRKQQKAEITKLANALQAVRLKEQWGEYWQREICMNWNDHRGCLSGCTNCDECDKFWRIQPQYCKRCGKTFFEREEETYCAGCRQARLVAAKKKWAMLHTKECDENTE